MNNSNTMDFNTSHTSRLKWHGSLATLAEVINPWIPFKKGMIFHLMEYVHMQFSTDCYNLKVYLPSLPLAMKSWLIPPKQLWIVKWPWVTPWNFRTRHLSWRSHKWTPWVATLSKAKRSVRFTEKAITGWSSCSLQQIQHLNSTYSLQMLSLARVWICSICHLQSTDHNSNLQSIYTYCTYCCCSKSLCCKFNFLQHFHYCHYYLQHHYYIIIMFHLEIYTNMVLQNRSWLSVDCTALYPRRQKSSQPPLWELQILLTCWSLTTRRSCMHELDDEYRQQGQSCHHCGTISSLL